MKILLTGAAGFIGSNLCEALLKRGDHVVAVDSFDPYYDREIKERNISGLRGQNGFNFVEMDLREKAGVRALLDEGFDVVVHLAGRGGVRRSIQEPESYLELNYLATLRLLEAMKETSQKKIVFASTSSIYGDRSKVPFREEERADWPISPYSATKKACETMLFTYHHLYDFQVYALRFFTVYGPRQRPDMAIYKLVRSIVSEETFERYGDGKTERDYTYVDDIVAGVIRAAERVAGYEIINIGGSNTVQLQRLISLAEEIIGKKAVIIEKPLPEGDVYRTYADVSKAANLIDFEPKVRIEKGLEKFVKWYLKEHKK